MCCVRRSIAATLLRQRNMLFTTPSQPLPASPGILKPTYQPPSTRYIKARVCPARTAKPNALEARKTASKTSCKSPTRAGSSASEYPPELLDSTAVRRLSGDARRSAAVLLRCVMGTIGGVFPALHHSPTLGATTFGLIPAAS